MKRLFARFLLWLSDHNYRTARTLERRASYLDEKSEEYEQKAFEFAPELFRYEPVEGDPNCLTCGGTGVIDRADVFGHCPDCCPCESAEVIRAKLEQSEVA